jgi:hypothetical protein
MSFNAFSGYVKEKKKRIYHEGSISMAGQYGLVALKMHEDEIK